MFFPVCPSSLLRASALFSDLLKLISRGSSQDEFALETFVSTRSQTCPPRGEEKEEEGRAGKGYLLGLGGVRGLDDSDN